MKAIAACQKGAPASFSEKNVLNVLSKYASGDIFPLWPRWSSFWQLLATLFILLRALTPDRDLDAVARLANCRRHWESGGLGAPVKASFV